MCVCVLRGPSCVPSLLEPSERVNGRRSSYLVLSLPVRSRVDLSGLIWVLLAPMYLPPRSTLPTYCTYASCGGGGGGGDCLGRLAGWSVGPNPPPLRLGSCVVAFFLPC